MKLLLIMPNFFDYPEVITKELENMGYDVDCFDDRPSTNSIIKAIIRVKKDLINLYIRKYFNSIMKIIKNKRYDFVLLISGQSLSFNEKMISEIKKTQSSARFVLYQWDSLDNFPYIRNVQKYFDKCYSFDREDTQKNENLKFLPLFYCKRYEEIGKINNKDFLYDFSFIGTAHPKKYRFISMMSKQLKNVYPKQYIYFFFPSKLVFIYRKIANYELKNAKYDEFNFVSLKDNQMNYIISNSRCILDCAQSGQSGLTIRVLEALGAKKKLITTNKDIINYDFYREENIYVYKGNFDYNSVFFSKSYVELDKDIYEKYSLRNWLNEILSF
ncbi:hypothetical protein QTI73_11165 [Clostridium perfringens]|nr:hypothetical protein [Clostridium perfringens]